MNNLELQGATAAPPFHGATVILAADDMSGEQFVWDKFWIQGEFSEKLRSNLEK